MDVVSAVDASGDEHLKERFQDAVAAVQRTFDLFGCVDAATRRHALALPDSVLARDLHSRTRKAQAVLRSGLATTGSILLYWLRWLVGQPWGAQAGCWQARPQRHLAAPA